MLDVIKAREDGKITKANVLKMDHKVNRTIRKVLEKHNPKYEVTIVEKVKMGNRRLPQPDPHQVRTFGGEDPTDLVHW